jgi:hypothetical protein
MASVCHGLRRVLRHHRLLHRLRLDHGPDLCTPEMLRMGYDKRLATASVAAGGTLGSSHPALRPVHHLRHLHRNLDFISCSSQACMPGLIDAARVPRWSSAVWVLARSRPWQPPLEDGVTSSKGAARGRNRCLAGHAAVRHHRWRHLWRHFHRYGSSCRLRQRRIADRFRPAAADNQIT